MCQCRASGSGVRKEHVHGVAKRSEIQDRNLANTPPEDSLRHLTGLSCIWRDNGSDDV